MKKLLVPSLLFYLLLFGASLEAQNADSPPSPTPASPDGQSPSGSPVPQTDPQNKAAAAPPPAPPIPAPGGPFFAPPATTASETLKEKFLDYAVVTVGPNALFTPALAAGIGMARPRSGYPRDWRLGAGAFGRNYGDYLAWTAAMQTGRFLTGALLHEDFRYRPSTSKNALVRGFHAVAFTFVDKSDSGHDRIALANFVGAASGGLIGNLYLPPGYNNLSHAETRMAITFGTFALTNIFREFTPEILKLTKTLHLPSPRIRIPEWWTPR